MIPKIIWQTYKDPIEKLPDYALAAIESWKFHNPEYEHRYMDDQQAAEFIKNEYDEEIYDLFMSVPVGVMRGDMWRYLVIYKYGGVYADLDTNCQRPVASWIKTDRTFIVCPEHHQHFCQWTFAAEAGHPILKNVIGLMIKRLKEADYSSPHFVHYLTGPAMWTSGICQFLSIEDKDPNADAVFDPEQKGLIYSMVAFNETRTAKDSGFYCYAGDDQWRIFHFDAVKHIYGSQAWKDGNYVQWIEDPLVKKPLDKEGSEGV